MIDSLLYALPRARECGFRASLGVADGEAVVVTLHRPSNVDIPERLKAIAAALRTIAGERPVLFPVHPRTRARIEALGLDLGAVQLLDPIGYHEMLDLVAHAHVVVTDSGGLQEETTALGIPCLTVRENTERPVTITEGTNQLTPDPERLPELVRTAHRRAGARRPEGWDGQAGERVIEALLERTTSSQSEEVLESVAD
jgi:UDP-N-acetylglucosamine 2-epimerase (non-hydrolysing)